METNAFSKMGHGIYRFRVAIILIWIIAIAISAPFLPQIMLPFKSTGFIADKADSTLAEEKLNEKLGYDQSNRFLVVYYSPDLHTNSKAFNQKIKNSLANLKHFPIALDIIYPSDNPQQISKDKHSAYAAILVKSKEPLSADLLKQFKASIKTPPDMNMQIGGKQIFTEGINTQTQKDLYRADLIAAPLTGIVLLLVFGTFVAMLIPVCLGGGCALIILTTLYFLGHLCSLSIFTLNLALLLGLCLSLDYALFIIFRFRSELQKYKKIENAIAMTLATAGRAIFFSGIAVFISLSALLLFPVNILFSIAIGGLVAVFMAVMIALTLLPAVLSVFGRQINALAIRKLNKKTSEKSHVWRSLAQTVVKYPLPFLFLSLSFLLLLSYSLINVKFGVSDFKIVPKQSESRLFFDEFKQHFHENELSPILLIVSCQRHDILSKQNISSLYQLTQKLKKIKGIDRVDSITTTNPQLSQKQYQHLYQSEAVTQDKSIQQLLSSTTGKRFTLIRVFTEYEINSKQNKALIQTLKAMPPGENLTLEITGVPVQNFDVMQTITDIFPYAVLWIMVLTYLSLLILLRSIFLPLKAIIMNVLSLSACYGVLVFIFQEGHFYQLLNFEPQGMLDITLVIIIFCAIFGFSMDYEVFLLTRIQEHYKKTHNTQKSIVFGIEQSSRIITSAALIVICICGSFMSADVLMVKEFGLGIAVAIAVDAFAIRSILVPSAMTLMKNWNWYIPKWLDKLLP